MTRDEGNAADGCFQTASLLDLEFFCILEKVAYVVDSFSLEFQDADSFVFVRLLPPVDTSVSPVDRCRVPLNDCLLHGEGQLGVLSKQNSEKL